jgi:G3E family GTPase
MLKMHLLTVAGFLGSGKTTLIIKLAEAAVQRGLKAAILVNEIGAMGIDDQLMRQLDLNVYQMVGGCVCCSLASNMPRTLQKLVENYAPDFVMIEPSGAAELEKVLAALEYYRGEPMESRRSVVLLDALRLEVLIQALTPLITSQINSADVILLNKIDTATASEVENSRTIVANLRPDKPIFALSARKGLDPVLIRELLP